MFINISQNSFKPYKFFRFENYWLEHANYIYAIRQVIHFRLHSNNPMHAFYHTLARVRSSVISIKQHSMGVLDKEIKMVESQI